MYYCEISSPQIAYVYDANAGEIVGIFSADDAKKVVALLNAERKAHPGPATEPEILFPHVYKRTWRDVARRYIQRFGGSTFSVQTAADDAEIYLRNRQGTPIATVSLLNRFPEKVDPSTFEGMPY